MRDVIHHARCQLITFTYRSVCWYMLCWKDPSGMIVDDIIGHELREITLTCVVNP
jgi:hypothetical protein